MEYSTTVSVDVWLTSDSLKDVMEGRADYRTKIMESVRAGRFEVIQVTEQEPEEE